ncbi:hypothetical protein MPER_12827, partial [Moniliophthora perniciosa FA553]
MRIPIYYNVGKETVEKEALIDSGAGGKFISHSAARGLKWKKLPKPIEVFNVDQTPNKKGMITHTVEVPLTIAGRQIREELYISGLGNEEIILGLPWLRKHNPDIDWATGKLDFKPRKTEIKRFTGILDTTPEEVLIKHIGNPEQVHI